jgi:hypothetical protein
MRIIKIGSLTDRNTVTRDIDRIEVINIYNRMAKLTKPLEVFMRAAGMGDGTP